MVSPRIATFPTWPVFHFGDVKLKTIFRTLPHFSDFSTVFFNRLVLGKTFPNEGHHSQYFSTWIFPSDRNGVEDEDTGGNRSGSRYGNQKNLELW